MSESQLSALVSWIERAGMPAVYKGKIAQARIYEKSLIIADVKLITPQEIAGLARDAALLQPRGFKGRLELLSFDGLVQANLTLDLERETLPESKITSSPDIESARELPKALSEALRASTQHTHAMAALLLSTVRDVTQGVSAVLSANERVIGQLVTRAERAELAERGAMDALQEAVAMAREATTTAEKVKRESRDILQVVKAVAGPKVEEILRGMVAGLPSGLNGTPPPVPPAEESKGDS